MPRHVTVTTPENVKIEYELAGLGSRLGAAVLDWLLQGLAFTAIIVIIFLTKIYISIKLSNWAVALLVIGIFLLVFGYNIYFETVWNGQTPGKRYARLRTVREGGQPIDLPCAAIRNLIKTFDMALSCVPGAISIMASNSNKSLGDYAAGTLVVKERASWEKSIILDKPKIPVSHRYSAERAYVKNIELITPEDFDVIKRFVLRQEELQDSVRAELAAKVAAPIMVKLGIEPVPGLIHTNLLSELYMQCVDERGMR